MVRDTKKVEPLSIKNIIPLFKLNFDQEDIKRIKESISEIGHQPIIVRHKGNKYQVCSNPEIFEALKLLGKDKIDVIVRDITEKQGKELTIATIFCHPDILSKDREFVVWSLWKTGCYKSYAELGRKIGISDRRVSDLIKAKETRDEIFGTDGTSDYISTETLRALFTENLTLAEKKQFCARIEDEKILPSECRDAVQFLNSQPEDLKKEILSGRIAFRNVIDVVEKRYDNINKIYKKAEKELKEPKTIKEIIKKEVPNFSSDTYRNLIKHIQSIEPNYIEKIEDETKKKQACVDEIIGYILHTWYMYKRGKIHNQLYNSILQEFNLDSKTVENLKADGYNYSLPNEWITPSDEKVEEKMRRTFT